MKKDKRIIGGKTFNVKSDPVGRTVSHESGNKKVTSERYKSQGAAKTRFVDKSGKTPGGRDYFTTSAAVGNNKNERRANVMRKTIVDGKSKRQTKEGPGEKRSQRLAGAENDEYGGKSIKKGFTKPSKKK